MKTELKVQVRAFPVVVKDQRSGEAAAPGWKKSNRVLKFGYCGAQRGFEKGNTEG